MTLIHQDAVETWSEPDTVGLRATVFVLPGRGESPTIYERFGRRLAADAYRVHVVNAPSDDALRAEGLLTALVAEAEPGVPRVLIGSDAGGLYAAQLLAQSRSEGISALVLVGLPSADAADTAEWDDELDARTACSAHRARISTVGVRRGTLYEELPRQWFELAQPERVTVPVLGLHGADDVVSPLNDVRSWFSRVPRAELVSIVGGRHDALNDQTHRSVAATIVLFLERLRLGAELAPIVVSEALGSDRNVRA